MPDLAQAIASKANEKKAAWKQARDLYTNYPNWIDVELSVLQSNITSQINACASLDDLKVVVEDLFQDVAKVAYNNAQGVRFLLKYLKGYTL